jgi:type II secretory pathway pseudopilin PulG
VSRCRKLSNARWGFTFVEILAALAFLGILIPVVVSALMVSNRAGLVAERSATAVQLGENQLNELMLGGAWSSAGGRGDFGTDRPGYRWELEKGDWESGEMTELTLSVFFQVQGQEHDVQLTTLVSEGLTQ